MPLQMCFSLDAWRQCFDIHWGSQVFVLCEMCTGFSISDCTDLSKSFSSVLLQMQRNAFGDVFLMLNARTTRAHFSCFMKCVYGRALVQVLLIARSHLCSVLLQLPPRREVLLEKVRQRTRNSTMLRPRSQQVRARREPTKNLIVNRHFLHHLRRCFL